MHRAARMLLLGGRPSFEPEALALFARMSSAPTAERAALMNALIRSLKTGGVWAKLDALYVMAAADAQAARLNWVGDTYNLSTVNSPTFTADRGYAGNGSSAYLETGFNPFSAVGAKYTRDSAHLALWDRTDRAASGTSIEIGLFSGTAFQSHINTRFTGDTFLGRVNQAVSGQMSAAVTSSSGFHVASRTGASAQAFYKNGSLLSSNATASVSLASANDSYPILAGKTVGSAAFANSADQLAAVSIGGGLTSGEQSTFYAAINTYLAAIGAN